MAHTTETSPRGDRAPLRDAYAAPVAPLAPPPHADEWLGVSAEPLPVGSAHDWAVLARCGAVVVFTGTSRDHAEGRTGVTELVYEAYEEQVVPRLTALAAELRSRWPELGRIALLHRTGTVRVGEVSVVVAVSAPHRAEAFEAARLGIDLLKATAPIWKLERWPGGEDWSPQATAVGEVGT